jgi:membrane protein implicated in regulation of membrane protease activity
LPCLSKANKHAGAFCIRGHVFVSAADYFAIASSVIAAASAIATFVLARTAVRAVNDGDADVREHRGAAGPDLASRPEVAAELRDILVDLARARKTFDREMFPGKIVIVLCLAAATVVFMYFGAGTTYVVLAASVLVVFSAAYFAAALVRKIRDKKFWALRKGDVARIRYIVNNYVHDATDARDTRLALMELLPDRQSVLLFDDIVFEELGRRGRDSGC